MRARALGPTGWQPVLAAAAQTALLVSMNSGGLLWARRIIPDPGGMIVKNFAFLVLAWVVAAQASLNGCGGMMRETPWEAGRFDARGGPKKILFGRMYEDTAVEEAAFVPGGRIFCIASAGVRRWRSRRVTGSPPSTSIRSSSPMPRSAPAAVRCASVRPSASSASAAA